MVLGAGGHWGGQGIRTPCLGWSLPAGSAGSASVEEGKISGANTRTRNPCGEREQALCGVRNLPLQGHLPFDSQVTLPPGKPQWQKPG